MSNVIDSLNSSSPAMHNIGMGLTGANGRVLFFLESELRSD